MKNGETEHERNDTFRVQIFRSLVPGIFWYSGDCLLETDVARAWACVSEKMAKAMAAQKSREFPEWRFQVVRWGKTMTVEVKHLTAYSGGDEIAKTT